MSIRAKFISVLLRSTLKRQLLNIDGVDSFRKKMGGSAGFGPGIPADVMVEPLDISGISCEWISFEDSSADRVMLYFHGGGYIVGGFDSHQDIAWRLAKASGLKVLLVDYRLAPESPFPAAVEDATACYRWLLGEGYLPENMIVGGDSAGGGLAVAALVNIKNLGLSQPSGAVLMSPWVDLTVSGDSIDGNAKADPMMSRAALEFFANNYVGDLDRRAPLASPLFADLSGLPPMLVHVGSTEVLRSDAERLVEKVKQANGNAVLEIWPGMPHVFQLLAGRIPEGKDAVEKLGAFMRNRTAAGQ
ncbi:MAG: alpha/beta hydrolase [Gammaproteobacteria bacterium]|jgi:acetyl esterase/lipase|nr:alpha/beta hydrolase [Gammaproteobacteria bacterium]|tara:strand:- start:537 stop:1445 length:909 start_codon:yes stop_codon:yes gene_type:complete